MTTEQLKDVESRVNAAILKAMPIEVKELPIDEARQLGAEAQFGEKYGDVVRVVSMGDYSIEFCGGTHLNNTSVCGLVKIVSESGVAAGVRRIEAVTGKGVLEYIAENDALIQRTAAALKTNLLNEIDKKAEQLAGEVKELKKKLESLNAKMASGKVDDVLAGKVEIGGISVVCGRVDGLGGNDLRNLGDNLKEKIGTGIAVLASCADDKIAFLATATPDAVKMGVHAGMVIKEITKLAGGSGGGKPDSAMAGGKDISKIAEALEKAEEIVKSKLK
jgi:alanyl-tRNA synthetase